MSESRVLLATALAALLSLTDGARSDATAGLLLSVTAPRPAAAVGADLTYAIEVTNAGPSVATGVTLAPTLSGDASIASVRSSQGTCGSLPAPTCTFGDIAVGRSATATVVARANGEGRVSVSATVTGNERDGDPRNSRAAAETTIVNPPAGLMATRLRPHVVLRWRNASRVAAGFQIERSTDASKFSRVGAVGRDATTFRDRTAAVDRAYTYRVRAITAAAASDYSNEVTVTVASPGALHVVPSKVTFAGIRRGGSETRVVILKNRGSGTLTGTVTGPAGVFSADGAGRYSLAPGATKSVTVRFSPVASGHVAATLLIASDDPKRHSIRVKLTGTAR